MTEITKNLQPGECSPGCISLAVYVLEPVCHKALRRHIRGYFHGIGALHLPIPILPLYFYMHEDGEICSRFLLLIINDPADHHLCDLRQLL